jgi:hypothetical protein
MASVKPFEPFIPNENARKWADALESGEYQQTQGLLHRVGGDERRKGFCCLGVAAKLAVDAGLGIPVHRDEYRMCYGHDALELDPRVQDWLGLRSKSGGYGHSETGEFFEHYLTKDNDSDGHDFKRIAMTIRTTPSLFVEATTDA